MKIRFSTLMVLVAVLLGGVFASCAPEEITKVPAKMSLENADEMGVGTLTLSARAETKSVSFTADGEWYIRIPKDCDWLTVSPASGEGDATVNFTTKAYEELVPRTAKVAFVCDNLEQKTILEVTQKQRFVVNPTVLTTVVPKTGGEYVVDVETNGTFELAIDEAGKQWLEVVSVENDQVVLNAEAIDPSVAKNTAKLTFTCVEDAGVVAELAISQKNLQVTIDAKEIQAASKKVSGELAVTLLNVTNWEVQSDASWIKVEKKDGKIAYEIEQNPTSVTREATFAAVCTDSAEDSDVKGVVTVKQYPGADLVNFVFNEDATAYDASPRGNTIRSYTSKAVMTYYEQYAAWGPTVSRTVNKSYNLTDQAVWLCEYTSFKDQVSDGYTLEAVFSIPTEHTNAETKAFGATSQGGFAIMLGAGETSDRTNPGGEKVRRDGSIEFIQHDGSGWCFGVTGVRAVPGKMHHVFGVWDGETLKAYVDGELKCTYALTKIQHSKKTPLHLAVTGNYNGETTFNGSWNGTVVVARMYDAPLSAEEIAAKTAFATSQTGVKIVK